MVVERKPHGWEGGWRNQGKNTKRSGRVGEETKVKIQKEEKKYKEKVSLFAGKNQEEQRK